MVLDSDVSTHWRIFRFFFILDMLVSLRLLGALCWVTVVQKHKPGLRSSTPARHSQPSSAESQPFQIALLNFPSLKPKGLLCTKSHLSCVLKLQGSFTTQANFPSELLSKSILCLVGISSMTTDSGTKSRVLEDLVWLCLPPSRSRRRRRDFACSTGFLCHCSNHVCPILICMPSVNPSLDAFVYITTPSIPSVILLGIQLRHRKYQFQPPLQWEDSRCAYVLQAPCSSNGSASDFTSPIKQKDLSFFFTVSVVQNVMWKKTAPVFLPLVCCKIFLCHL